MNALNECMVYTLVLLDLSEVTDQSVWERMCSNFLNYQFSVLCIVLYA